MAGKVERMAMHIPGRPQFVRAAGMAAYALAAQREFTYDRVKDIEAAVEHVCDCILMRATGQQDHDLALDFVVDDDTFAVEMHQKVPADAGVDHVPFPRRPDDDAAMMVVRALVDEMDVNWDAARGTCVTFVKYRLGD
jgi:hypothetical protein